MNPLKRLQNKMFLYLMETNESVKIGVSSDPIIRRDALQTGCSDTIRLVDSFAIDDRDIAFKTETILHCIFQPYRRKGEWFDKEVLKYLTPFEDSVVELINKCRDIGTVTTIDRLINQPTNSKTGRLHWSQCI